jgi:hypothetical protein
MCVKNARDPIKRDAAQEMEADPPKPACRSRLQTLGHFFEKLQLKEEAEPSVVPGLFSTHMMTSDRIAKVNRLIARFPDRLKF